MWFDTADQLVRAVVASAVAYIVLVAVLRWSGKRTLAKLNAFDFVVTIALGSTLASIATSSDVAIAEGVVVLVMFVALQFVVAWAAARSQAVRSAVKAEPVAVLVDGVLREHALRQRRLSPEEVRQAVRASGIGGLELVAAVVLETDGTLSVIPVEQAGSRSALDEIVTDPLHHRSSEREPRLS
ncbi:MAG: DUF421 domain-containing protein [Ilumatobacteraceae bacterium]|nr:DUF421 domain-containing protein [Acidimicrobiales bacterium]MCB9396059.1 DUF421 domain-containing protein [Acidimicrobiaceae bacterium]